MTSQQAEKARNGCGCLLVTLQRVDSQCVGRRPASGPWQCQQDWEEHSHTAVAIGRYLGWAGPQGSCQEAAWRSVVTARAAAWSGVAAAAGMSETAPLLGEAIGCP